MKNFSIFLVLFVCLLSGCVVKNETAEITRNKLPLKINLATKLLQNDALAKDLVKSETRVNRIRNGK